jgi:phosphatidylglycerophosphate synthase
MVLIPHLFYVVIFGADFQGYVPQWLMIITAVMYFMYMNLDNMDGKQARRTGTPSINVGTSSALGMLMDH